MVQTASVARSITQNAHNYNVGTVLYFDSINLTYKKANANDPITAEVVGIVSEVTNLDEFVLTTNGYINNLSNLVAGTVYFLSDIIDGLLSDVEPTINGHISKPLLIAVSDTEGYFINFRGQTVLYVINSDDASNVRQIYQPQHGYTRGKPLYFNGITSDYQLAKADDVATAEVIGIVSNVIDEDNFVLLSAGYSNSYSGLIPGNVYFLSDIDEGELIDTEPITNGHVSKPLLIAISDTEAYFVNFRGQVLMFSMDSVSNARIFI